MKTAGVRELKAHLSRYLDEVRRGEVLLITDRGHVVAELRRPMASTPEDPYLRAVWPMVERGELRLGNPSLAGAKPSKRKGVSAETADRLLDEARSEAEVDRVVRETRKPRQPK